MRSGKDGPYRGPRQDDPMECLFATAVQSGAEVELEYVEVGLGVMTAITIRGGGRRIARWPAPGRDPHRAAALALATSQAQEARGAVRRLREAAGEHGLEVVRRSRSLGVRRDGVLLLRQPAPGDPHTHRRAAVAALGYLEAAGWAEEILACRCHRCGVERLLGDFHVAFGACRRHVGEGSK